jgi:hydroxyacylglutathione hydrolase
MPTEIINFGMVNAFLLPAGEGFVLIDSGLPKDWPLLEQKLVAAGALPDRLKLLIITHGDWDHTGNCLNLRRRYHTAIAMHPGDVPLVRDGFQPKREIRPLLFKVLFAVMRLRRKSQEAEGFSPDLLLSDGQRLDQYGLAAEVMHIPGHTKGSIAVITDDGELFPGDTVTNRNRPDYASFIEDRAELKASIARVQALKVTTVYPGHGRRFGREELLNIRL